jgi:hypothetical protein
MREHAVMEETFSMRFMAGLYNEFVGSVKRREKLVTEAGDSSETQRNGERLPLEATTKQHLVKTEMTSCVL